MMIKYPKTMHLPWSPGLQNDDRLIDSFEGFVGREVVVTEKMDGENASLYRKWYHARSLDSRHHPSRDWIKAFHGSVSHNIPDEYRVCGENLYAQHSIVYDDLESYFMGFSLWKGEECFDWDYTLMMFEQIGVIPVRTLWEGLWEDFINHHEHLDAAVTSNVEGYVVRTRDGFFIEEFKHCVAKFVRKDHIQTDIHWMQKKVEPNGLRCET